MRKRKKYSYKYDISIRKIRKRAIQLGQSNPDSDSNHNKNKIRKKASRYIFNRLYRREIFEGVNEDLEYFINDLNGEKLCLKKV